MAAPRGSAPHRVLPRGRRGAGGDRVSGLEALFFLAIGPTLAFTGGIRGAFSAAAAVVGDRRQTRLLLGLTAIGVAALALLPPWLTGPVLSGPAYGILTTVSILGLGALLAPVHVGIRHKREEIVRQRNEIASDALTRAESLEQIGSKLAHELKNPLTGVKALVQLGLRSPEEACSHRRLEVVEREVTRMQDLLRGGGCHHPPVPHRRADRRDAPRDRPRAPGPGREPPRRHRYGRPRLQVHAARLIRPRHPHGPDEVASRPGEQREGHGDYDRSPRRRTSARSCDRRPHGTRCAADASVNGKDGDRSHRKWCTRCGGHLFTDHPTWGLVDVYAATLPGLRFQPGVHVNYQERVLPMRDGLPKLKDFPQELGGSGDVVAE